ncbi:MAG: NAD(P)-binding protein [Bdellovibrionaceae bacterium]|nr:NAD(P)-binding protein [Pseudobdellovibrionaceae bacterium]
MKKRARARIAVVGGGAAGITAAYLLSQKHEVCLFESGTTLGGHAHAEELVNEKGHTFSVDTAFLIFNEKTYPNFIKLIKDLEVDSKAMRAEMSSCFADPSIGFSYTLGAGWTPFLKRPSVVFKKEFRKIVSELLKFRKQAAQDIDSKRDLQGVTAGEYFQSYDPVFVDHFVWPLTSAIWSLAEGQMRDYPIATLLEYFDNHQLIRGKSEKKWRTFDGSSQVYVDAFMKKFNGIVRLNLPIQSVKRTEWGVEINSSGWTETFDYVIMATHADTSLKLLLDPTDTEKNNLGAWTYKNNPVTLHSDISVLHEDRTQWGSWNMRRYEKGYRISYYLNRLQNLPTQKPIILTLGDSPIDASKVIKTFTYRHKIMLFYVYDC